jgi:hypothetical protein
LVECSYGSCGGRLLVDCAGTGSGSCLLAVDGLEFDVTMMMLAKIDKAGCRWYARKFPMRGI